MPYKTKAESAESESRRGKRILIVAAIISVLVVLGIASAVYWRLHHERKFTARADATLAPSSQEADQPLPKQAQAESAKSQ